MELKIWVEGIQRIVCGVTDKTTCQDVVYALAHATGKTGRFTLIERWRKNERLLAPHENPLKVLLKWGEYSSDVQFILQRTPLEPTSSNSRQTPESPSHSIQQQHSPAKDIKKSLTFSGGHSDGRVGVVRGVPQTKPAPPSPKLKKAKFICDSGSGSDGGRIPPPYREPPRPMSPEQNRTMAPPPYRDPPPPIYSPSCSPAPSSAHTSIRGSPQREPETWNNRSPKTKRSLLKEYRSSSEPPAAMPTDDNLQYDSQCRDLIRLIKTQQDKINEQQEELSKCDADITHFEVKSREQQQQMECVTQEISRLEGLMTQNEEQLRILSHMESENDVVRQQEKTLQSEMTLLRSKVSNCETELLQCKNKSRLIFDELQNEQRVINHNEERDIGLRNELDRLQYELEQAKREAASTDEVCHKIEMELRSIEGGMSTKREIVEKLVQEMKDANLQSLSIAPSEELRLLAEGSHKTGRKMVGSPRQLENAVPTSKNPHGVWV